MIHIGTTAVLDGDLTCEEDTTIEGRLTGDVYVKDAALVVTKSAHLEGNIRALRVTVHGTVHGTISAGARIEIAVSATVTGDLSAEQVVIADGTRFNCRVDMGRRTIAAKVAQYKAAAR